MRIDLRSRRMFLRGLGSAVVTVPFLASLCPRDARAEQRPASRFVFMGHYFGRDIDSWYPRDEAHLMSPEGVPYSDLAEIEGEISHAIGSAFDPVRPKISLIRGLDSLEPDDGHCLSQSLTASGTNPVPSFGYSLDVVLEESAKFYPVPSKLGALRTSVATTASGRSFSFTSKLSYGQVVPPIWDPRIIYQRYFDPAGAAATKGAELRKTLVTNQVFDDFKAVSTSARLSAADRQRLDNYMSMLTSVEARLGLTTPTCQTLAPGELTTNDAMQSLTIDLEVAALTCGLTNLVVHTIVPVASDPSDNVQHHTAAHANGLLASRTEPGVSEHATYDRWVMTRVAEMLRKLDSVEEPDGSRLLDNTFFLYANSESRGFHTFYDMPVLVAGGRGRLNLGRYIDYRPRPLRILDPDLQLIAGRPYNNLLITLLQGMGLSPVDYQRFGRVGFGTYANFDPMLAEHYAPFLTAGQLNAPLPFLFNG